MSITEQDILHVARLARLSLTDEECPRLAGEMSRILDYFAELSELDTRSAPAASYAAVESAPLRADRVTEGLDIDSALGAAPRQSENAFAVPTFVDEG